MRVLILGVVCVACATLIFACATPAAPAPAPAMAVPDQLARGAPLYAQNCATANCHGTKGEGIREGGSFRAWPLVGPDFRARNPNAQAIFDVVRSGDEQNLRALTDQQIYDAVAYELSLNGARLTAPLSAQNAATLSTGAPGEPSQPGAIFPPTNAVLLPSQSPARALPAANGSIGLRVDQMAQASSIGSSSPPNGGTFAIIVLALQDLTSQPLAVDPKYLRLEAANGAALEPQTAGLASPIEQFHAQTIEPEHGTAAIAVFALPAGATARRLIYDDGTGHPLSLSLAP